MRQRASWEGDETVDLVALAGSSGVGKTAIALRSGLQTLGLDAFFRDATDTDIPMRAGRPDWQDVRSYHLDDAARGGFDLLSGRTTLVPVYSYLADKRTGFQLVGPYETPILIEGIFAFDVANAITAEHPSVNCVKILLTASKVVAAVSRVTRDSAEQRQPFLRACQESLSLAVRDRLQFRQRACEADVVVTRRQVNSMLRQFGRAPRPALGGSIS